MQLLRSVSLPRKLLDIETSAAFPSASGPLFPPGSGDAPPSLSSMDSGSQNETRGWCRRSAMTIQEAIDKAIEGGYPKERVEDLTLHVQAEYFLETTFWEALVRAPGVEGDFEYIHLDRGEHRKMRQPM